jgi:hypothetical protein
MRFLLSGLLLSVSSAALAQQPAAWDLVQPEAGVEQSAGHELMPGTETRDSWQLQVSPQLSRFGIGTQLSVPLPDGNSLTGRLEQSRTSETGGHHYLLSFGQPGQGALLHVGLNATYGRIWAGEETYVIEPTPNGGLVMRIAPDDIITNDAVEDFRIHPRPDVAEAQVDGISAGSDTLDFLYFYDIEMIETHGWGIPDLAATDIGNLDSALAQSGVSLNSDLTQLQFMDVARDYPSDDLLTDLGNRQGVFNGLQTRIDSLGVDVVSLNRVRNPSRESFCGLGYVHDPTSNFTGRAHINVCHNGLTLAHETGHNMGLAHGLETDGTSGRPVDWARGFRIDSASGDGGIFTSVMAYGINRQPQFSDPTLECPERGSVCGIPLDPADDSVGSYATEALRRYAVGFPAQAVPNNRLRSSVLPTSRFVATGSAATAFMTVINPNQVDGTNCIIEHHGPYRDSFTFQRTDPNTNAAIGNVNDAVTIPAGGYQTYVISLTPSADVSDVRFVPYASCDNIPMPLVAPGLNTIDLGSDAAGGPDLIALAATLGNNGIVDVPANARGVFSVATINLGGAGDVTVSAQSLDPDLPATGQVCQTDAGGACMAPPANSLTLNIGPNETPTFGVFVRTNHVTPFSARQRFQFQMRVGNPGELRGSTSVAVRDQGSLAPPVVVNHAFTVTAYEDQSGALAGYASGYFDRFEIVQQPTLGTIALNGSTGAYTYTASATGGVDTFTYRAGNASGWSGPATATVTVNALPLPVANAFTIEDDTDGVFQIDLDDHVDGNIAIDRFLLTSNPSETFTFDELTGVMSIELPADPGSVSFGFAGVNRTGQGNSATGTVNVVAYDACAPAALSRSRLERRLRAMSLTVGATSADEANTIGTALCMEEYNRTDDWVYFRNTTLNTTVVLGPRSGPDRYIVYYRAATDDGWTGNFSICKTGASLGDC